MDYIKDLIESSVKIEKKELEPCLKQVVFTIPADKVSAGYDHIAKEYAKHAKIDGFRPGKAPIPMIKSMYKKQIEEETLKELLSESFKKASADDKEELLSYNFEKDAAPELKLGSDLNFTLRFNIAPEFELPQYVGVKVEVEKKELTEDEIAKRIDYYRDVYGKFEKVAGASEKSDMLKISYTSDAVLSDAAPASVKRMVNAEMNYVWLNSYEVIPGINAALLGAKEGDTYKHQAIFAPDFEEKELAGKTVNYDIKVQEVQRKAPIKDDAELCHKLSVKDIGELKERVKKQAERELENAMNAAKRNKIIEDLSKNLDFPVPPDLLNEATTSELQYIISQKIREAGDKKDEAQKEITDNKDKYLTEAKELATKRLRTYLLLRKIANKENIKVEHHEVDKHIESMSQYYGYKAEDLRKNLISSGKIEQVFDEVMINKVSDFIAEKAEPVYVNK